MKRVLFTSFIRFLIVTLVIYLSPMPFAFSNPAGGTVSAGSATITASGKTTTINQNSDKAAIDWSSFNINADEVTRFNQPSPSSMMVNRIHDAEPSKLFGTLSANGNIFLINPNGVLFGPHSMVDVSGLVATTSNVRNKDFMSGNMRFVPGSNPNAAIVNQGNISVKDAGLAALVAPNVVNSGTISAKLGKVHLASGDSFTLDMFGDGLINVGVSDAVTQQIVQNIGKIDAAGGTIELTAAAGKQIVNSLIDVAGELDATSIGTKNGQIFIYAEGSNAVPGNIEAEKGNKAGASTVLVSGLLDASGTNPGEHGGKIEVLADNVGIKEGAIIDASGDTGGGTIKIGGDFHGAGTTPTALNTYVANALILANANSTGNGGNVAVWSDGTTQFYGNILAEGGAQSGDGGFVETSGHGMLDAQGYVDLTAMNGNRGTYLLDPTDVTIYGNTTSVFDNTHLLIGYAFDEGAGTSATDSSGNNYTGINSGATYSSNVAPTPFANAYSLTFNGTTDAVNTGYKWSSSDTNLTVSAWVKTTSNSPEIDVLGNYPGSGQADLELYVANGKATGFVRDQGGSHTIIPTNTATVNDGNWHLLALVVNGTTATVYVDGVAGTPATNGSFTGNINTSHNIFVGADSNNGSYWNGSLDDIRLYNNVLSTNDINELTGNRFTVAGLHTMSQTANVSVQASNNITMDFQGDTLSLGNGKSLTLNAGNIITTASAGTITANNADISMTGTNGIQLNHAYTMNSNGGNITFNNPLTLGANLAVNTGGGNLTTGTINGAFNLTTTGTGSSTATLGTIGGTTPLNTVSITTGGALSVPNITAASITAQTTGGTSDLTIPAGKVLTASGAGTPITVAAGRNFINSSGSGALSAPSGRWLVYSTNPANDTIGSLSNNFRRFTCAYGGACPSLGSGNGLLYSYTPNLTVTPNSATTVYGNVAPAFSYGLTGYLGSDSGSDSISGSPAGVDAKARRPVTGPNYNCRQF